MNLTVLDAASLMSYAVSIYGLHKKYGPTGAFIAQREKAQADFIVRLEDLGQQTIAQIARLEIAQEEIKARLALLEGDEHQRVLQNYFIEATREAIAERRTMLVYAAVGGGPTDYSIATLSRAERAIRELDPDDVIALSHMKTRPGFEMDSLPDGMPRARIEALVAAGCVLITTSGGMGMGPETNMTSIGRIVLAILQNYLAARAAESNGSTP